MNPEMTFETAQPDVKVACAACSGDDLERFFRISELPTNCVALAATRKEAVDCAKGSLDLAFCRKCGAISNLAFDPSRLSYDASYDNSLHFSLTFQKYADELAHDLVKRHNLRGKNIIDIGCGNAEFLSMVCEIGNNRGTGFDPSLISGRADLEAGKGIAIIRDYYSERHAHYLADFVICRQVLEHIDQPQQFLRRVRATLAEASGGAIFLEVPNASFVFRNSGIWDIIYEHCFYYSSGALVRLFSTCGFDVLNVSETFNGQYLGLEARVSSREIGLQGGAGEDLKSMREDVLKFSEGYRSSRTRWEDALRLFASQGKRATLWGAGAKGAMFLNAVPGATSIEYIVDVNPHKWGLYIPGTGQKVVSPEFLKQYRPDVLLLVNPNYRDEISHQVSGLGLNPDLLSI